MSRVSVVRKVAIAFAAAACFAGAAHAGPYSALFGFGDSLTDVGNDAIVTGGFVPTPVYYTDGTHTGRFTNGLNYYDRLGAALGVGVAPSIAGGNDYAYGGARVNSIPVPGGETFDQQIADFASTHPVADPNALYLVWIGANDMSDAITNAVLDPPDAGTIISNAIAAVMASTGNALATLAGLGAQHFLVPNLPDLALIPAINGVGSPALSALAHQVSVGFDGALDALLGMPVFDPLDIRGLDVYGEVNAIVSDPAGFGFTDTTHACYSGDVDGSPLGGPNPPTVCANPDQYVFWDYEHPTAATGAILGQLAYSAAIPEPPGLWALALVAAAFATWRRRGWRWVQG
jgi:outer membrane lipase/esterase